MASGSAGYGLGWLTAPAQIKADADAALSLDEPVKRAICEAEKNKPHSIAFKTYCANIPTSVSSAIITWAKVFDALEEENHATPGTPP